MRLCSIELKSSYDYECITGSVFKLYLRENIEQFDTCCYYDEYVLVTELPSVLSPESYIEANWNRYLEIAKLQDNEAQKLNGIKTCKDVLANSDYQVLKCAESFMIGSVLPYDFSQVLAMRTAARDKIAEIDADMSEDDVLLAHKQRKITEMCAICQTTITNGIDYNGEHYRLNTTDQINLTSLYTLAHGGQAVPYHADGQVCRIYEPTEMVNLVQSSIQWITYHTTYFNLLKHQILSMETSDDINAVYYGMTLKDEYQAIIDAIAEQ